MLVKESVHLAPRGVKCYHRFSGVDKAFKDLLYSMNDVIVYFDPDVDGVIAGVLVCRFLASLGKSYTWYINSNRSHDWSLPVGSIAGRDIIAVDFLIEPEKIKEICEHGCNLITMDHHVCKPENLFRYTSRYSTTGILINNQYKCEDSGSRYLSGAGVVFETLVSVDPSFDTNENRALVGITLLSDIRDIENPLAEYYLYTLYTHKYKGYVRYLIDAVMGDKDYGFGLPRMDRSFVDYKLSPAINSCLRFNEQDMVVDFMLGKSSLDLSFRQAQKELVNSIVSNLSVVELSHLRVCYFLEENFLNYSDVLSNFVGLVASRMLDGRKSVICYMVSGGRVKSIKRASFRGNINGVDYRSSLFHLFECLGHNSAFGIKGIVPKKEVFLEANRACGKLEQEIGYKKPVVDVANLSMFNAYKIAEDNIYRLSQNMVRLRYTGSSIQKKRSGGKFTEYSVNGVPVKCFSNIEVSNGLILPIIEREIVNFYLE